MASYPFTWTNISEEERSERLKMYLNIPTSSFIDMVRCDQNGFLMPTPFVDKGIDKKIWEMQTRSDDIWVATYPKCGTTMTSVML